MKVITRHPRSAVNVLPAVDALAALAVYCLAMVAVIVVALSWV